MTLCSSLKCCIEILECRMCFLTFKACLYKLREQNEHIRAKLKALMYWTVWPWHKVCQSGLSIGRELIERVFILKRFIRLPYRMWSGNSIMLVLYSRSWQSNSSSPVHEARCSAALIWGRRPGGFLESYWSSVHIGSSKGFKMHMTRLKKLVPTLVMESAEAATE